MSVHDDDGGGNFAMPPKWRRSFLAERHAEADGLPPIWTEKIDLFQIASEEDDIPTLTEVVTLEKEGEDAAPLAAETPLVKETPTVEEMPPAPPLPAASGQADIEALAAQMAQAINQQMSYELPTLVEATLLNIVADLRAGIASTMEAALRDFVAKQKREHPDDE
jgi:hypothetical protein